MNRYDYDFIATCPSDGKRISYHLIIESDVMMMVEEIIAGCQYGRPIFHEALADDLSKKFVGHQYLAAKHQGVLITTYRFNA